MTGRNLTSQAARRLCGPAMAEQPGGYLAGGVELQVWAAV
jgi:hypothetical protein